MIRKIGAWIAVTWAALMFLTGCTGSTGDAPTYAPVPRVEIHYYTDSDNTGHVCALQFDPVTNTKIGETCDKSYDQPWYGK